ncbi:hypothetical protein TNCV_1145421 [Trichonephila clavipes]|nr:hypothetical protein TNCV_1145421 [Trichonephila clavipes]
MTEHKPRRTKGRTCVQRGVASAMRVALRDLCIRSTSPLDEGWYDVALILLIPKHTHNSLLRWYSNLQPWSVVIRPGTPNRGIYSRITVAATVSAVISEIGYASGQREK